MTPTPLVPPETGVPWNRPSARQIIYVLAEPQYGPDVPRRAPPARDDLDVGWNLSVLFRAYLQRANAAFGDLPGGPRAYQLLVSVERSAATSQLQIARRLGIDRTVMTYLIDDLVDADLVERHIDPADRRVRTIKATPSGRRLLPALDRRLADIEQQLLVALPPSDARQFRELLRAAAAPLEDADDPRELAREIARTPIAGHRRPTTS
jgi:MarR family transcriptional regulator for hemolysin